ncbi:GNAT family N-acetyltransferase [Planosporangium flavigriseum]|uniref:GNAT family N-acetyltransferase n=1 Tax=Planosporangium flavigriseum TaxID=373681 RepID=UPI001EF1CFF4|nr:GNAT family N-acetyltransferase [Planosporangium flavigriseum]
MLREFRRDDVDAAFAIVGDEDVTRWLSFDVHDQAATQAMIDGVVERAQAVPRTEYYLVVTLPGDELIGFARLGLDGVQAAKLGYAIRHDQWGHGYATDAARALVDFGFRQLGLHRISAAIGPDNEASIAVVKRLGMQYEGRIRDHVFTNGSWRDSLLYSVLAAEWEASSAVSLRR